MGAVGLSDDRRWAPAPMPRWWTARRPAALQPAGTSGERTLAGADGRPADRHHSPTGWRTTKPAALRTSGCQPIPALPSCGPAALWVSQRNPATYMNTWSALA